MPALIAAGHRLLDEEWRAAQSTPQSSVSRTPPCSSPQEQHSSTNSQLGFASDTFTWAGRHSAGTPRDLNPSPLLAQNLHHLLPCAR
ncbi:hypothetical protein DEDE109153_08260 [Deinococcus deserti]